MIIHFVNEWMGRDQIHSFEYEYDLSTQLSILKNDEYSTHFHTRIYQVSYSVEYSNTQNNITEYPTQLNYLKIDTFF
jgi:hypothetical protein